MRKYCIPQPQRVRRIENSFAWIDHRLLRNGYIEVMTHHDQALYLFLALVADRHGAQLKQLLWTRVHPIWPEYEKLFAAPFGKTGRRLLMIAPTPTDVLALDPAELTELVRKASRGKFGPLKVEQIRQAAACSVGMQRGHEGACISIRSILTQIEALVPIRAQLEADMAILAERIPAYVLTLPGADPLKAVSLFGETDPIETFRSPEQLVAFAGLEPTTSPL